MKIKILIITALCMILNSCSDVERNNPYDPHNNNNGNNQGSPALLSFSINGVNGIFTGSQIIVHLPEGTDKTALTPEFNINGNYVKYNNVMQTSGVTTNNFTNPLNYTVYGDDGLTATYTVIVSIGTNPAILSFSINGVNGVFSGNLIYVTLPEGTNKTALIANFTINGNYVRYNNVTQISGVTTNNFTNPLTYTVYADGGLTANYTITVSAGNNLALNKNAFASSTYTGNYYPNNCIDGDETTMWSSGQYQPSWIVIDLYSSLTIKKIRILSAIHPNWNATLDIYGSNDGNIYESIMSDLPADITWHDINITPTQYRYIKIVLDNSYGWMEISEVEIY